MLDGRRVVCIIPARGGSKGLPGKNVKPLAGKPLIAYSIEQAKACAAIDRVVVSTDDESIAKIAEEHGAEVPFLRPAELATDNSSTVNALIHAVGRLEESGEDVGVVVLLHATAPLRAVKDIDACIEMLARPHTDNVVSVTPARHNPYFNMVEISESGHVQLAKAGCESVTRQEAPNVWDVNASIYVWWKETLLEGRSVIAPGTRLYEMPAERSVDIDTETDFILAEALLARSRE